METTTVVTEDARFKAAARVKTDRILEFYAAAFGPEPDAYGDIIEPTAFDAWLPEFYAEGQALTISFNHAAVLDALDPTNVIGFAPADPEHVWVDSYGLRVKAFLDVTTEKGKAVEFQVESGLLKGASLAYFLEDGDRVKAGKGFRIKRIRGVSEAGLVQNPANQAAVLLWMKSEGMTQEETELPYMTVAEFRETFEAADEEEVDETALDLALETLTKHAASPGYIQSAHDALVKGGAKCASEEIIASAAAAATETKDDPVRARLRRLRALELSTY